MNRQVCLGDVADVFNGKTPSKAEQRDRGHPVLKVRDVDEHGRHRGTTLSFVDHDLAAKYRSKWVKAGDTLILNAAHNADYVASKTYFAGDEAAGSLATGEWLLVRPRADVANAAYLNFWLRSGQARDSIRFLVKGIHLYPKDVAGLELVLPALTEQHRVVDLLSRAEGIVRLRRQAQQKAAALIPTIFVDMFGDPATNPKEWPRMMLGDLIANGPTNGLYKHKSAYGSGTPILRIDAFYDGRVTDLATLKRVQVEPDEQRRFALAAGDIIVNRVNSPEYLGKSAIVPELLEPTVFESNMMRFSIDALHALPEFVIALLQDPSSRRHFLTKAKHAINQSSINQQDVKSLPVFVPPLSLQRQFAQQVAAVLAIEQQQQAAMAKAEATFSALLARAFAVEDPQEQPDAEMALA